MKWHPLLYLLAVLVMGAAVWVIEKPTQPQKDDHQQFVFFPELDPMAVKKLRITHLLEEVVLEKKGDQWSAVSDPDPAVMADPWKVGAAIRTLKTLESQSLISRDAASSPRLQTNVIGTHIQAYDASGQVLADLTVGKVGPDLISSAVRREGDKAVYLVKGYLAGQFPTMADQWKMAPEKK